MTFKITGPGEYVNRRGEKVKVFDTKLLEDFCYKDEDGNLYNRQGYFFDVNPCEHDIIGPWVETASNAVEHPLLRDEEIEKELKKILSDDPFLKVISREWVKWARDICEERHHKKFVDAGNYISELEDKIRKRDAEIESLKESLEYYQKHCEFLDGLLKTKKSKRPIEVGDRVATYSSAGRHTGKVLSLNGCGWANVKLDVEQIGETHFEVRHCRRIKKKV